MKECLLTIDFEDFKHDLKRSLSVDNTSGSPEGLSKSINKLNEILKQTNSNNQVTYFITGQVARDYPEIVRKISENNNEIACHGNFHDMIYDLSRQEFGKSLDRAIKYLKLASGKDIIGFRAPSFSINKNCEWAFDEIAQRFKYDSSYLSDRDIIEPVQEYKKNAHQMLTLPIYNPIKFLKMRVRVIGGTFLKLLPLNTILNYMREAENKGYMPIIYIHPYELLTEDDFKVKFNEMKNVNFAKRFYWLFRQNQWLSIGNKSFVYKLEKILTIYSHVGTVQSYLKRNNYL